MAALELRMDEVPKLILSEFREAECYLYDELNKMRQLCPSQLTRWLPKMPRLGGAGWWKAGAEGDAERHLPLRKVGKGASMVAANVAACAAQQRHCVAIVIAGRGKQEERKA